VKIGFHVTLKLLRDGAEVLVTTRFPRDAARRFAAVPDCADWLERLHVHGVDLLDLAGVAALLESVHRRFEHLDILVNNAAQTIRRPVAYHREVRSAENDPLTDAAARVDVTDARKPLRSSYPRLLKPPASHRLEALSRQGRPRWSRCSHPAERGDRPHRRAHPLARGGSVLPAHRRPDRC
jgi:NAD(P)-dependent dehydrogenase (short-subunit alcohol dehydrogenase family)